MSRYIDADLILYRRDSECGTCTADKRQIDNIRTADVRENVRGEWIHDEITMNGNTVFTPNAKCSICDCYVYQESNFCPNCGADNRGD